MELCFWGLANESKLFPKIYKYIIEVNNNNTNKLAEYVMNLLKTKN